MHYNVEPLTPELAPELEALFRAYYDTTPAHTGIPPYDFNWPMYHVLHDAKMLLVTTARDDDGKLVGCALYVVMDHLHHRGLKVADCDTLAVDHTMRGKGIGRALYQFTEDRLREHGVHRIMNRYRTCYQAEPLFPKLGFELEEHVYTKRI